MQGVGEFNFGKELAAEHKSLRNFANHLTKNRQLVEDLVQDTYERCLMFQDKFQPGTNIRAWAFMVMRNKWYTDLREYKRQSKFDQIIVDGLAHKIDMDPAIGMDLGRLLDRMSTLSDVQRYCFEHVVLLGESYEEVAIAQHVPVGTIKSRVCRGRATLLDFYDPDKTERLAPHGHRHKVKKISRVQRRRMREADQLATNN